MTQLLYMGRENHSFAYAKTAQMFSVFIFDTRIEEFILYIYSQFQDSSFLLSLYRPVCVRPGREPRKSVFSRRGSYVPFLFSQLHFLYHNSYKWIFTLWLASQICRYKICMQYMCLTSGRVPTGSGKSGK